MEEGSLKTTPSPPLFKISSVNCLIYELNQMVQQQLRGSWIRLVLLHLLREDEKMKG
jgi:hypothetical protein